MNSGTQELPDSVTQPSGPKGAGSKGLVQFGVFELNMQTGELRKNGVRVRLQGKPFQILQALLESPGEVVTREELRKRLWPADTFVDFESGLNTAANRLRLTLGESAENPRYVQTLSRTGYRFIATVTEVAPRPEAETVTEIVAEQPLAPATITAPAVPVETPVAPPKPRNTVWMLAGALALLISIAGVMYLTRAKTASEPVFRQITFRRGYVDLARFAPDEKTVLYAACWNAPASVFMVSPGSPESRSLGFSGYYLMSVSKSGELILSKKLSSYRVPMNGGSPKLFMEDVKWSDWLPNGDVALVGSSFGTAKVEFPRGKVVFQTSGYISHLRASPRGEAIAFLEHPMAEDDGGNVVWVERSGQVHHVSSSWASIEGLAWSPDGGEIWFTASRTGVNRALYAATRSGSVRMIASIPGTMTLHDISPQGEVVVSRDTLREVMLMGKAGEDQEKDISWFDWSQPDDISRDGRSLLFTEGGEGGGREYGVYIRDFSNGSTTKLSDGEGYAFFPDGKSVLTMLPRENTRMNIVPVGAGQSRTIDGHGLSYQGAQVFPDGKKLLVIGSYPGKSVRLYTQSVDGSAPVPLEPEINLRFPKISPDGTRIAGATYDRKIAVIPAVGGKPEFLPIETMHMPVKWSADGKRLLIRTLDHEGSALLDWVDLQSGKLTPWRQLKGLDGEAGMIGLTAISQDEKTYVYASQRRISELFVVNGWR